MTVTYQRGRRIPLLEPVAAGAVDATGARRPRMGEGRP